MKTIGEVKRDICKIKESPDICDAIIMAFEGYEFEGEDYVHVGKSHAPSLYDMIAYVDRVDAPQVLIDIERREDGTISVVSARIVK